MNEGSTELLVAVGRVVAAFEALKIEYLIGGSLASSVFGEPRQTVGADLLARVYGRHAEPLVQQLSPDFYADLPSILAAIQRQGSFNLIHLETMAKVAVFVRWRTPFAQAQFERSRKMSVSEAGQDLFFASPEDTVLAKLVSRWGLRFRPLVARFARSAEGPIKRT